MKLIIVTALLTTAIWIVVLTCPLIRVFPVNYVFLAMPLVILAGVISAL